MRSEVREIRVMGIPGFSTTADETWGTRSFLLILNYGCPILRAFCEGWESSISAWEGAACR
jgi:hypothetical protein